MLGLNYMQTLLSKPLVAELKLAIKKESAALIDDGVDPQLAVILIGNDSDSLRYVAIKDRTAKEVGIIFSLYHTEASTPYEEIEKTIAFLNADPDVHGIIIQLPLPDRFSEKQTQALLALIDPVKDVDGLGRSWEADYWQALTTEQLQVLHPHSLPPMVSSVISLLDFYNIDLKDKKVVLMGKDRLVGQPLLTYFKKVGVSATLVDEETPKILDITKEADVLITATGQENIITYQWIKEGAVVVDCAFDVHEDSVGQIASALAPATGGVGPLTVNWLLYNTVQAARNLIRKGE